MGAMSEQPGRYQRSSGGLVGALLVLLLVIGAFLAIRGFSRDNRATPVRTVDYVPVLKQARADHRLLAPAPDPMPNGWRATSVRYVPGAHTSWHLGILTDQAKYVGIEESQQSPAEAVDSYLGTGAVKGTPIMIGRISWQTWSEPAGDFALTYSLPSRTVFVGGSAGEQAVRTLTRRLSPFDTARLAG